MLKVNDIFFIVLLCFSLLFCNNWSLDWQNMQYFTIGFAILASIFLFLSNVIIIKIVAIISLFCSAIYLYCLNKFGVILDENIIANALLSIGHVDEIIDFSLLIYFGIAIFVAIIVAVIPVYKSKYKIKFFCCCLLIIIYAFSQNMLQKVLINYSPFNYYSSVFIYLQRFHNHLNTVKNRQDLTKQIKFSYEQKSKNLNVIVILGESLRADHMQIYGYNKQTTPQLSKVDNLLKFKVLADFDLTNPAINSLLSHRLKAEYIDIPPEKSAISVFKHFGFDTYWYSAQSSKEFGNGILNILGIESDFAFYRDYLKKDGDGQVYDQDLLPHLQSLLNSTKNNFIILHTFGSHIRFHDRYPSEFAYFLPECKSSPKECSQTSLINSYDNTVLYADDFLAKTIKMLENTNSIVFFISDHGQFLGENGIYGNGGAKIQPNIHTVPMLIYASKSIWQNKFYQQKLQSATKKITANNLTQDIFFDSLLDCVGIDSDLFNRNLSLCR